MIEKAPRMKLPIIFTKRTLTGRAPNTSGEDTILYLKSTPTMAPTTSSMISADFNFFRPTYHIGIYYFEQALSAFL